MDSFPLFSLPFEIQSHLASFFTRHRLGLPTSALSSRRARSLFADPYVIRSRALRRAGGDLASAIRCEIVGGRREILDVFLQLDKDYVRLCLKYELGNPPSREDMSRRKYTVGELSSASLFACALRHSQDQLALSLLASLGDLATTLSARGLSLIIQAAVADWHFTLFDALFLNAPPYPAPTEPIASTLCSTNTPSGLRSHPDFWFKLEWYLFAALHPGYYARTAGEEFQTHAIITLLARQDAYGLRGDPRWHELASTIFKNLVRARNREEAVRILLKAGLPLGIEDAETALIECSDMRTLGAVLDVFEEKGGTVDGNRLSDGVQERLYNQRREVVEYLAERRVLRNTA
ncbi:hypothetical protein HDU93_009843 [Gonapodya sp. JEL0774]|nr:hypothetical protein HDU93_009843 [Gonapodya sp. JEL0774]